MRRSLAVLTALVAGLFVIAGSAGAQTPYSTATAELRTGEGDPVGTAQFVETPQGVEITAEITGNVPAGTHGFHIHETGDLSDPAFESAGDHFDPTGAEHGFDNPNGPHAGDLENITISEDGTASYSYLNDRITLSDGQNSILDEDGSAIVIHAMEDDYTTNDDPETGPGMSGDRVAAGVIEPASATTDLPSTGGPALIAVSGIATAMFGFAVLSLRRLRS